MAKKQKISDEAARAVTEGDLWSLFITEEILDKIVDATNEKIEEDFIKKAYTTEYLQKAPHIKHTDKVKLASICYFFSLFKKLKYGSPVCAKIVRNLIFFFFLKGFGEI
jgi:hypothetical protein